MGRDPSEVFSAMNRAREALRLKIYSEAIAASQEAIDRVARATEELETARDEYAALDRLLQRLATSKFSVDAYRSQLARIRSMLDQVEGAQAREALKELRPPARPGSLSILPGAMEPPRQSRHLRERTRLRSRGNGNRVSCDSRAARCGRDRGSGERLALAEVQLRAASGPYIRTPDRRDRQRIHGNPRSGPRRPRATARWPMRTSICVSARIFPHRSRASERPNESSQPSLPPTLPR